MAWHDGHYSVDDVKAQVFSDTGAKVGSEILVNTAGAGATFSLQNEERIVALSNGGFAVAWTDKNGDDSSQGVKAQLFNATGGRVGTEILVNTTTLSSQLHPQLAALKNGAFVVTWDNWSGTNPVNSGIDVNAQIFDNSGARVGSEILANTSTAGTQGNAQIASLANGDFAISWFDSNGTWSGYLGVPKYQVFDALGHKVGSEQVANTTAAAGGASPITALDSGKFVVAWNSSDDSGSAVKAQVFVLGETLTGGQGNDSLPGTRGNDIIDGGLGVDAAIYTGKITDYFIKYNRALGTATISDHRANADGTDSLKSIERLQFADKTFDLLNPARTESAAFGKSQSFLFDPAYYLLKHPDLVPTVTLATAFDSYKTTAAQGAAPNAWFDPVYYANRWADLKPLNLDAVTLFAHYNLYGVWEGRSAGPTFDKYDGTRYLKDNPDVAA